MALSYITRSFPFFLLLLLLLLFFLLLFFFFFLSLLPSRLLPFTMYAHTFLLFVFLFPLLLQVLYIPGKLSVSSTPFNHFQSVSLSRPYPLRTLHRPLSLRRTSFAGPLLSLEPHYLQGKDSGRHSS